jgi:hypothetical protein
MIKLVLTIFILTFSIKSQGQKFINLSKSEVKAGLERYLSHNKLSGQFENSDTSLTLTITGPHPQKAEFIYYFDEKGKCKSELRRSCNSCIKEYLESSLAITKLDWKQLNPTQYISSFSKRLVLEVRDSATIVNKMDWDKKTYRQILSRGRI